MKRFFRRKDRVRHGRVLVELDYANAGRSRYCSGWVPIALLLPDATDQDLLYVRQWLRAVQHRGDAADAFLETDRKQ